VSVFLLKAMNPSTQQTGIKRLFTGFARVIALISCISLVAQSAIPAMAQSSQSTVPSVPASQSAAVPAPSKEPTTSTVSVPFDLFLKKSLNPLDFYRGKTVPPPNLANSVRLNSLIRDGKIYLTLRDAIDLALEDNLDMVIARYNLPIAQMDILRTAAGGQVRGVNTGVVSGTPGGAGSGAGGAGGGGGAGGTTGGAGGAGTGTGGLVSSTLGTGTAVSGYDPFINANIYNDHTSQQLTNFQIEGVPIYKLNTNSANVSYNQAFPTGSSIQVTLTGQRVTSNGIYDYFSPSYATSMQAVVQQQLLAGFGLGPNLRYLRIARTNKKISDIAFRAQVIATITQICNLYWDLVAAYDTEQVNERSVAFANETLDKSRKQLDLQAIPQMDVLKAEGDLATRKQELTVARTTLELQELYMKNAITRSLDDPVLEDMPVVPTDHIGGQTEAPSESIQEMIADAMKNRTDVQEQVLQLQNSELSRKTARNALLPTLDLYGVYSGSGAGGQLNQNYYDKTITTTLPGGLGGALQSTFDNTAPEYRVGVQLSVPLRNREAKADQYRTELEYRQSQVYLEERKKSVRIEVRNARFALEQGASRVEAAREARDLSQKTLDIMQKEQQLGSGSNQQTLSAQHDLAVTENALVTAETDYEKARVEILRATGTMLEAYGIAIEQAKTGAPNQSPAAPVPSGQ
jgi:outer membrane protein TolC